MLKSFSPAWLALSVFVLAGCAPEQETHLMLAGGHMVVCSSMGSDECQDWQQYRDTELAHVPDEQIRYPKMEGVSLADLKIDLVLNDPAWDGSPEYHQAARNILFHLQSQSELFASWDDFRSAFLAVDAAIVNTELDGLALDGNAIWFNVSDAQWSTFSKLKITDDTINYSVSESRLADIDASSLWQEGDQNKQAALQNLLGKFYSDEVFLADELQGEFADTHIVEASVNGYRLWKSWLTNDEFDGLLNSLEQTDGSFLVNADSIATVDGMTWDDPYNRVDTLAVLNFLLNEHGGSLGSVTYASYGELKSAFTGVYLDDQGNVLSPEWEFGDQLWADLSNEQQLMVLRNLVNDVTYERPIEYVALHDSVNPHSIALYEEFVAMARQRAGLTSDQAPKVLMMTSSSNNSYDAVDFYVAAMEQAGADAQWLPVDRAYQDAIGNCSNLQIDHGKYANDAHLDIWFADYAATHLQACEQRQSVLDAILAADGLFINGGGQRRSLDALRVKDELGVYQDTPELIAIRDQVRLGKLVLGGTSAGTAVQAGGQLNESANTNPMIDGGQSYDVLLSGYDEGIMVDQGGIGLFKWGITDTHFSERGRQARLIALAQQQGVRFGFGVDETTALTVSHQDYGVWGEEVVMTVTGQSGVWIADLANAEVVGESPLQINNVTTHYLTAGDQFILRNNHKVKIRFAKGKQKLPEVADAPDANHDDVLYKLGWLELTNEMFLSGAAQATGLSYELDPQIQVTMERGHKTKGKALQGVTLVSYKNLMVHISLAE